MMQAVVYALMSLYGDEIKHSNTAMCEQDFVFQLSIIYGTPMPHGGKMYYQGYYGNMYL